MAVDVCSEISSPGISPRISFSHDLKDCDRVPVEESHRRSDGCLLESSSNFDFCIGAAFIQELSSAEELFSNGKILPVEIKKPKLGDLPQTRSEPVPVVPSRHRVTANVSSEKKRLKEFLSSNSDTEEIENPPQQPRSFWQFKRSNSLNCEINRSRGLMRSLHFLSRSNSTGSAPNPKQHPNPKYNPRQGQSFQRQPSVYGRKSSFGMPYSYNAWQQQKTNPANRKSYGSGVRISPVLNFQPHISIGTVNLFGFGSLFCNGKVKKKKK
ncbi:uncharacterized protein LOC116209976 [Punica granatum]|uniref:Uncharacterized protein n=2 Tax=Punica granatum TaxID=22663 RepID=A0A218XNF5_PUNGR|nr:uncharacterized protein LOC116209976 [Punica granatum]OWM86308.1 hypothetical protein CDL15_Pgr011132 [Punica granatum]PKI33599.1 hypothetical protein CRG98_046010 [Punica granatum]